MMKTLGSLNRRRFLQLATATAATLSGYFATPSGLLAAVPSDARKLDALETEVFARLARLVLPTQGTALVPAADIPILPTLEGALLVGMEPHVRAGVRGAVNYFNTRSVKDFGAKFVALSDRDGATFCDALANSANVADRSIVMALKKLVVLSYWANPPTWGPLGYDGPVSDKWHLKSLGNAPLPKA